MYVRFRQFERGIKKKSLRTRKFQKVDFDCISYLNSFSKFLKQGAFDAKRNGTPTRCLQNRVFVFDETAWFGQGFLFSVCIKKFVVYIMAPHLEEIFMEREPHSHPNTTKKFSA